MNPRTKATAIALAISMTLALSACTDAGKQLALAAKTNRAVQNYVIAAEKQGLMTVAETKVVVDATSRIAAVGLSAVALVEQVKSSDPESQTKALDALGLVVDELNKLQGELGIKNDTARHQVEAMLAAVQTSLNSARVVIAASK